MAKISVEIPDELLAALGTGVRLDGTVVRDSQNNYRNASLPRATNVSDHRLVDGVDQVTTFELSAVKPQEDVASVRGVVNRDSEFLVWVDPTAINNR